MFEKSKAKKHLSVALAADGEARREAIGRLVPLTEFALPMLADQLRANRILFADALAVAKGLYAQERLDLFVAMLGDGSEPVRELSRQTIEQQGKAGALGQLAPHLAADDTMVRKMTSQMLVEWGNLATAAKVIPMLRHESRDVRKAALDVLVGLKAEGSAQAIAQLLTDGDSWLRRKVVEALCRFDDRSVLPAIQQAVMADRDPGSLRSYIELLGRIGTPADGPMLLSMVRDRDMTVRNLAVDAITNVCDATLVPQVIELLGNEDVDIRRAAVTILNGLKDPSTAQSLVTALKDGDWWVREVATEALSQLGGSKIAGMIRILLKDDNEQVRRAATEFFCRVRDERVYEDLMEMLADPDWWAREKAITALGLIGDPRAVPAIARLMGDREVVWAIPKALAAIGGDEAARAMAPLIKGSGTVKGETIRALAAMKGEGATELLMEAALDADQQVVHTALTALRERTGRVWLAEEVKAELGSAFERGTGAIIDESGVAVGTLMTEAILVVDLVNSTDIASSYGDALAFELTDRLHKLITPVAVRHRLAFRKSTGDGYLMTFPTVFDAVATVRETLDALDTYNRGSDERHRFALRFAVNMGETRVDANRDRIGLAVNTTFRVEGLKGENAVPLARDGAGGNESPPDHYRVLVTETARKELEKRPGCDFGLFGYFEMKGVNGVHPVFFLRPPA